jgi:hypothetical protein
MAACPVCETPRAPGALECPTCGHVFSEAAVNASITPLGDLEPTLVSVGEVASQMDPDLEPTTVAAVGAVATEAFPDLETTLAPKAPAVAAEVMLDLEPTAQPDENLPTAAAEPLRCRYCGHEGQTEGRFCDRCGMRRPSGRAGTDPAPIIEVAQACRMCGGHDFSPAGRCLDCGAQSRTES